MKTESHNKLTSIFRLSILSLLMLTFSCTQDSVLDGVNDGPQELNAQAAKSENAKKVTKKISGKIFNFADPDQTPDNLVFCVEGFPITRNIINGRMTHLGKLQPGSAYDEAANLPIAGSYGVPVSCSPGAEDLSVALTEFIVYYVAANGDRFVTEEKVTLRFNVSSEGEVDFGNGTFENTNDEPIIIVGGTGRFEGATGELMFQNASFSFDAEGNGGSTWELVGEITY